MSMAFSGTMQGAFVSTGVPYLVVLRSGFSWIKTYNITQEYANTAGAMVEGYFDPISMTNGQGTQYTRGGGGALSVSQIAANAGFFVYDSSIQTVGPNVAITAITTGTPPVVDTANTAGLVANSTIVRIYQTTNATQLEGIDFTVGAVTPNTSFQLLYGPTIALAGTNGSYSIIPYDPFYYPRNRIITAITAQANTGYAQVVTSVTGGFVVGQKVTFTIPQVDATHYGITQLNGQTGTVIAVDLATNTFTVNINITGYGTFAFPINASPAFTPAQITPAGSDTAVIYANNVAPTGPAYVDTAQTGVLLMSGANSPAGVNLDQILWVAGTSWNTF